MSLHYKEKFKIVKIKSREILDSRGNPTVEVEVFTKSGYGRACVPSGASTGAYEALELRDGDQSRYGGKGVLTVLKNINEIIAPKLIGKDCRRQDEIDKLMIEMDGTENKSHLGANAILGVSLAVAKAAANTQNIPLFKLIGGSRARSIPVPMMNVINGGKHAGNELKIQEFMILPIGADSFREALRMGVEIYHKLKDFLKEKYGPLAINVGDEGGYAPPMKYTEEALKAISSAVKLSGYKPEDEVFLGIDSAATSFYDEKNRNYLVDGKKLKRDSLIEYYKSLCDEYPLCLIEDPLQEDDFEGFAEITKELGGKIQIVGDDLFVTNIKRLKKGISLGAANTLLLKVNQVGTLSETIDAAKLALENNYRVIVSHRSGETGETIISDIAVGLNAGQIKAGAPARGERVAKYNQLLRIEEELGSEAIYAGKGIFKR
jgi:enolase